MHRDSVICGCCMYNLKFLPGKIWWALFLSCLTSKQTGLGAWLKSQNYDYRLFHWHHTIIVALILVTGGSSLLFRWHQVFPWKIPHFLCLQQNGPITEQRQRVKALSSLRIAMADLILGMEIKLCFCREWQLSHEESFPGTKHFSKLSECFLVRMSSFFFSSSCVSARRSSELEQRVKRQSWKVIFVFSNLVSY